MISTDTVSDLKPVYAPVQEIPFFSPPLPSQALPPSEKILPAPINSDKKQIPRPPNPPLPPPCSIPRPYDAAGTITDAEQWVKALSAAVVDVLAGRRDARSIQRWISPQVYAQLTPMAADYAWTGSSFPALPMAVRLCPLSEVNVEFAVTVWDRHRARAVAGRIVAVRDRWLLTELETR